MTSVEIEQNAADEAMNQGYYGFLNPKKRVKMSLEKLVIQLSKLEKNSPSRILLEHELNLRLAKEQSKATLSAGWLSATSTILAVFIAAAVGYIVGNSSTNENIKSLCEKTKSITLQKDTKN